METELKTQDIVTAAVSRIDGIEVLILETLQCKSLHFHDAVQLESIW